MVGKIACLTPVKHIKNVWDNLNSLGEVYYAPYATYEEACLICQSNDIVFVNPNKMTYRLDNNLIENSNLKAIITASTGTNHIDLNKKVKVYCLAKEYSIIEQISSTAEQALTLMLGLIRKLPWAYDSVKNNQWDYEPFIGRQINKLTVGVIGYGRLGKKFKNYMDGLGAEVLIYDPYVTCEKSTSLTNIQNNCDVISIHVHLNAETQHMIDYNFLSQCIKKPYIINTSRGAVVKEKDIIKSLNEELISGYGTDVLEDELKNNFKSELIEESKKRNNILITPHIGGMTKEAQEIAYNGVIELFKNSQSI
jgi:D-3-phosphoglycerate dehydrogenase